MPDTTTPAPLKDSLLAISVVCGALLVIHLALRFYYGSMKDGLDAVALGLAVVGLSPWIARIITTLKFGGVEVSFVQALQAGLQKQGSEIEQLRFLITKYLPVWELQHLRNLVDESKFEVNLDKTSPQFEGELRHLRSLNFIEHRTDKHGHVTITNFFKQDLRKKDVGEYFKATSDGRKFMEHYESSIKALNAKN